MKFISLFQILELHRQIIAQSGGLYGVRDMGGAGISTCSTPNDLQEKGIISYFIRKSSRFGIFSCNESPICSWQVEKYQENN